MIIGHFGHALGGIGQTMEKQELEVKQKLKMEMEMEAVHDLLATVVLSKILVLLAFYAMHPGVLPSPVLIVLCVVVICTVPCNCLVISIGFPHRLTSSGLVSNDEEYWLLCTLC